MARRITYAILALGALAAYQPTSSQGAKYFNGFQLVDKEGNISKPVDFRDRYELLGSSAAASALIERYVWS